jgi:hypothetical protein
MLIVEDPTVTEIQKQNSNKNVVPLLDCVFKCNVR